MRISPPHRPAHESDEFWYYPKKAVLLYENRGDPRPNYLEAKHSPRGWREHRDAGERRPEHWYPHGIKFKSCRLTRDQEERNAVNAEFVVRMCLELDLVSHRSEPNAGGEGREDRLLPVPKFLALFLETNRVRVHEAESITQAILLLQARALTEKSHAGHCPVLP